MVRSTDRPVMTISVDWDEKQQNKQTKLLCSNVNVSFRDHTFDSKMTAKRS